MTVAHTATHGATAPRRSRLDAVLALRYRHHHRGVYVHCDDPFKLNAGCLDIPFEVWKYWRRLRLHVVPDSNVPPTVLLLTDSHGNPLFDGRGGPVHNLDRLDVDLMPTSTGAAFSLVLAGPANVTTVRVVLHLSTAERAFTTHYEGDSLPIPRVREVTRS